MDAKKVLIAMVLIAMVVVARSDEDVPECECMKECLQKGEKPKDECWEDCESACQKQGFEEMAKQVKDKVVSFGSSVADQLKSLWQENVENNA